MIKYLCTIAVIAAGLLTFFSCKSDEEDGWEKNLKKGEAFLAENAKRKGVVVTESGLQYEVLAEGLTDDTKSPTIDDLVRCHYQGSFIDGKVFDSSYGGKPALFPLNGVIRGWTEGLQYMTVGAKYRFFIPYQLGYGASGYATIPPYSALIFDVELIEIL